MNALTTELAGRPESAWAARNFVRQALGEHHPSAGDAELIISELVTNAIVHSRSGQPGGKVTVAVETSARSSDVVLRVIDAGAVDQPRVMAPRAGREHGRGLRIVAALAAEWGTEASTSGRSTWCRITPEPRRSAVRAQQRQPAAPAPAHDDTARGPRMVDGYVMNYGGPPNWSCVVQINEALRGRTQPNGVPIADMWPQALHRSWDAMAQRQAEDREAEP